MVSERQDRAVFRHVTQDLHSCTCDITDMHSARTRVTHITACMAIHCIYDTARFDMCVRTHRICAPETSCHHPSDPSRRFDKPHVHLRSARARSRHCRGNPTGRGAKHHYVRHWLPAHSRYTEQKKCCVRHPLFRTSACYLQYNHALMCGTAALAWPVEISTGRAWHRIE